MRRARAAALAAVLVVALGGAGVVGSRAFLGPSVDYTAVVSIERAPVYQDPARLERAFALPVAATYRGGLDYQKNPSFCGPASLVNVLRSVGVPAEQEGILAGSGVFTVFGILPGGMTLDRLAGLVERRGLGAVTVLRDLDLASFRAELAHANEPDRRYIVNFHRGPLFGRGGGHHSPIAGYLADEDLVLVLDVNRSFRPWLVRTERLFAAVDTVDPAGGRKRGVIRVELKK